MFMKDNKLEEKIFNNDKSNDSPLKLKRVIRKSVSLKGDQILEFIKNNKKQLNLVEKDRLSPLKRIRSPKRSKKKVTHKELFNNLKDNKKQRESYELLFESPKISNRSSVDYNYYNNSNYPISENRAKGCFKPYLNNFFLKKQLSSIMEEKHKDKQDTKKNDNESLSSPRKIKKSGKIPKTADSKKKEIRINYEKQKSFANNSKIIESKFKKKKKIIKDKFELDVSGMDSFFNKKQKSICENKLFHNELCKKKTKN